MNFFKKPLVAVLLSGLIIVASTLLSVNIHFGNECREISDGFYDGVYANGYTQKSISSHLRNICGYADGMVTIANNYDIDTASVKEASENLKLSLSYSYGDADYIYFCYEQLMVEVRQLEDSLSRAELGERDADGYEQYASSITGAQSAIESAGYNESVREFLRENLHFPANLLAPLAGVALPEYFE